jgi:phage tail protein X
MRLVAEVDWQGAPPDGTALLAAIPSAAVGTDVPSVHRISAGETVASVAGARFGEDAAQVLLAANPWLDVGKPLPAGVWLVVPPPGWRAYRILAGDTVASIALAQCGHEQAQAEIVSANPWIHAGMPLRTEAWILLPPMPPMNPSVVVPTNSAVSPLK